MPLAAEFLALCDRFLDLVSRETGYPMIICDERAVIVRATIRSRIGNEHTGAQRILRGEVDDYAVTAEEAAANPLVKEGYNCPILVDGQRVGTFGIAGKLELTRPVARLSALVLAGWIKELRQQESLRAAATRVFTAVEALASRAESAARSAAATGEATSSASQDAAAKVDRAHRVVELVQKNAQESRILSINGAVEATRVGDRGRAFGVIATDMARLAQDTSQTSNEIQTTLAGIRAAVADVNHAASRSVADAVEAARAVADVTSTVGELKAAIERLEKSLGDGETVAAMRRAGGFARAAPRRS